MSTIQDELDAFRLATGDFKRERWITTREAHVIYDLILRESTCSYFESGTANGFSTYWAMIATKLVFPEAAVHTWDPIDRPKIWNLPQFQALNAGIHFHNENYNDSIKETVPAVRWGKALFFIDGDHKMQAARNDIRNTMLAANPGDVMLLHDVLGYEWLNGRFKEFESTHRTEFFATERGMGAVWLNE